MMVQEQLSLLEQAERRIVYRLADAIRPANMRTVHGIRIEGNPRLGYSVSAVRCVEDKLVDDHYVRVTGGGLDAPEDLPIGSVKVMFDSDGRRVTGICQRTSRRPV
jgi:hypothetical protein